MIGLGLSLWCSGNVWDGNIRTEGDSLMDGAYGFATRIALAALIPEKTHTDTSVGGSTIDQQSARMIDPANSGLRNKTTIWWDGSQNGITTITAYADAVATGLAALSHRRFVIIPPINPYGYTYSGSQAEAIATEFQTRWPDNFLHWDNFLNHTNHSIAAEEFYNPGTDINHLSRAGVAHAAIGIYSFLRSKGWIERDSIDPILSAGSVWLFDPGLEEGAFSGTPANGTITPNVAWHYAAAAIGSGDANTLGTYNYVVNTASDLLIERSARGGLHSILSQNSAYVGGTTQGLWIQPRQAIQMYLDNSVSDDWYFSVWYRPTRAPLDTPPGGVPATNSVKQSLFSKANTTSNYLFYDTNAADTLTPSSGANFLGKYSYPTGSGSYELNLNQPILRSIGTTGYTGTKPNLGSEPAPSSALGVALGSFGAWSYFNNGCAPSGILYRAYAEHMAISGRTFAQASAMDGVLFDAAFGVGGRFYNDTYTDPVVLP